MARWEEAGWHGPKECYVWLSPARDNTEYYRMPNLDLLNDRKYWQTRIQIKLLIALLMCILTKLSAHTFGLISNFTTSSSRDLEQCDSNFAFSFSLNFHLDLLIPLIPFSIRPACLTSPCNYFTLASHSTCSPSHHGRLFSMRVMWVKAGEVDGGWEGGKAGAGLGGLSGGIIKRRGLSRWGSWQHPSRVLVNSSNSFFTRSSTHAM